MTDKKTEKKDDLPYSWSEYTAEEIKLWRSFQRDDQYDPYVSDLDEFNIK